MNVCDEIHKDVHNRLHGGNKYSMSELLLAKTYFSVL